jgi:hypothetical protein
MISSLYSVAEGNGKGSSITDKSQIPSTKLQINHNFQKVIVKVLAPNYTGVNGFKQL